MSTATFSIGKAALAAVASILGFWIIQALYIGFTSPLKKVPGPLLNRFTYQPLRSSVTGGRRIFYIDDLHKKYGPVVRISPTEVAISDVEGFKQIHAVSSKFTKSIWYEKLTHFPRLSVFTIRNPKAHSARRRLFARAFSKSYLRENWESTVKQMCHTAVQKIKAKAEAGPVDIHLWFTFMATDIVGRLGFGESFGMLELGQKSEYIRVLHAALVGNGIGAELPWLRAILKRIPAKPLQEAFNSSAYILGYGTKALENARKYGEDSNIMAAVMAEGAREDSILDDMDVRTEATSLIFAGSGTTANTLAYLIWCILSRPELQKQIEAEVATVSEDFTDADLEQLPLLNATIMETLRLYCAVPGSLPRVAPEGGATIHGYFIPENTTCSTQAWTLHREEASYEKPHEFNPARYLPEATQSKDAKATFCAFGAGAYSCLGIHLAWMELRCASTYFFRECAGAKLGPTADADMKPINYFVITPVGKQCLVSLPSKGEKN